MESFCKFDCVVLFPIRLRSTTSGIFWCHISSCFSTGSSQYLEPPDSDLRPEQKILSSEEAMVDLRKRDRAALSRLTGKGNQKVFHKYMSSDYICMFLWQCIWLNNPYCDSQIISYKYEGSEFG